MRGLVLVPTKELARQAQSMIQQLAAYCARDIRVANVSAAEDSASQRWGKNQGCGGVELHRDVGLGLCAAREGGWSRERSQLFLLPALRCCPLTEPC